MWLITRDLNSINAHGYNRNNILSSENVQLASFDTLLNSQDLTYKSM